MTLPAWIGIPAGILLLAFIVFAFRQGMQVKPRQEAPPPEQNGW